MLYLAIASGAGLTFFEAYPSLCSLFEEWGILLTIKLALLWAVPFLWGWRLAILIAVLAIASVGSHMSKRLRHSMPFDDFRDRLKALAK
jgi:hypothetical protein